MAEKHPVRHHRDSALGSSPEPCEQVSSAFLARGRVIFVRFDFLAEPKQVFVVIDLRKVDVRIRLGDDRNGRTMVAFVLSNALSCELGGDEGVGPLGEDPRGRVQRSRQRRHNDDVGLFDISSTKLFALLDASRRQFRIAILLGETQLVCVPIRQFALVLVVPTFGMPHEQDCLFCLVAMAESQGRIKRAASAVEVSEEEEADEAARRHH